MVLVGCDGYEVIQLDGVKDYCDIVYDEVEWWSDFYVDGDIENWVFQGEKQVKEELKLVGLWLKELFLSYRSFLVV